MRTSICFRGATAACRRLPRRFSTAAAAVERITPPTHLIAQPLPQTHPHLMNPGEVTPGISANEYQSRRARLAATLPLGSVALFPAAPRAYLSHDVPFPHYQDSDLYYLCGLQEHSSLLAVTKPANGGEARWTLFVRPECPQEAMWDGPRAGVEGARRHFVPEGAAHPLEDAARVLHADLYSHSDNVKQLLYSPRANPPIDALLRPMLDGASPPALANPNNAEPKLATTPPDRFVQVRQAPFPPPPVLFCYLPFLADRARRLLVLTPRRMHFDTRAAAAPPQVSRRSRPDAPLGHRVRRRDERHDPGECRRRRARTERRRARGDV